MDEIDEVEYNPLALLESLRSSLEIPRRRLELLDNAKESRVPRTITHTSYAIGSEQDSDRFPMIEFPISYPNERSKQMLECTLGGTFEVELEEAA